MKKDHIFKRLPAFAAGMLAVAMLAALAEPVSAAGAKIAYNQVGIRVMREQQVKAGQTYTAPSGQQIPFTITYTDAAGIQTNYIAAAQLSKLLDADISWDEETSSIEIGVPPVPGEVTITVENRSNDGPPAPTPSNEPEYGLVIGNLEEIDPPYGGGCDHGRSRQLLYPEHPNAVSRRQFSGDHRPSPSGFQRRIVPGLLRHQQR